MRYPEQIAEDWDIQPIEEFFEYDEGGDMRSVREGCLWLNAIGVYLVGDFVNFTKKELLSLPKIGKTTVGKIKLELKKHGFAFSNREREKPRSELLKWGLKRKPFCYSRMKTDPFNPLRF